MTISPREKRLVLIAGVALALMVVWRLRNAAPDTTAEAAVDEIPFAEKQLGLLRQRALTVPFKEALAKQAAAKVTVKEKGLIQAETADQAQAQLLQIVRRIGRNEKIDARGGEFGPVRPLSEDYGEVSVAVTFECGIEQLINLLAALTTEDVLLATNEIQITSGNPKTKILTVRLALAGVVPRRLVPEKKGAIAF